MEVEAVEEVVGLVVVLNDISCNRGPDQRGHEQQAGTHREDDVHQLAGS